MQDPINQADLARRAGVSKTSAAKMFRGKFAPIVHNRHVDATDPRVAEYINEKTGKTVKKAVIAKRSIEAPQPVPEPVGADGSVSPFPSETILATSAEDIELLEKMTIKEIALKYGTVEGFRKFVEIMKLTADYKYREIKNESERGTLIDRDVVKGVVFPMVDTAFARLVSDVPTTLAPLVIARALSGGDTVATDVEKLIRDANSKVLKNVKQQLTKSKVLK
jgi:hypothetical protein